MKPNYVNNPFQSGRIPPIAQQGAVPAQNPSVVPQQSIPNVAQPAFAQQPQPQQPPQQPAQQAPKRKPPKRKHSKLFIVGLISCIVAVVVLLLTIVLVNLKPFGLLEQKLEVEKPTMQEVEKAFGEADIDEPALDSFQFIDTDDLRLMSTSDFNCGEVKYTGEGSNRSAYCDATATAEFENEAIKVEQPMTLRMEYNKTDKDWSSGKLQMNAPSVTPLAPPDMDLITEGFDDVLMGYNKKIAEQYAGCTVTTDSTLTINGGAAVFVLTKTDDGDQVHICQADTEVTWNDSVGWKVVVVSISGDVDFAATAPENEPDTAPVVIETNPADEPDEPDVSDEPDEPTVEEPDEPSTPSVPSRPSSPSTGNNNNNNGGTTTITIPGDPIITQTTPLSTGDPVEVPGTIVFRNNNQVLLRLNNIVRLTLDGRNYDVRYFELRGSSHYTYGEQVTVIGAISATGTLEDAPLVIDTDYQ